MSAVTAEPAVAELSPIQAAAAAFVETQPPLTLAEAADLAVLFASKPATRRRSP